MDDRTLIEPMDQTIIQQEEGDSRKQVKGWLTIWNGFLRGRDFPLYEGRNFVGSDAHCEIGISDIHFPKFAFNIRVGESKWTLIDLDSDDGVLLGEKPVFRQDIQDEDWIKSGNLIFRVKKR